MDNKAVIARLFDEVLNQGNLDLLDELIGADYVEQTRFPGNCRAPQGSRRN
jgi:hypothetical protein